MKKILMTMVAVAALTAPFAAQAEVARTTTTMGTTTTTSTYRPSTTKFLGYAGPYVEGNLGWSIPDDSTLDNDIMYSVEAGVRLAPQVRLAAEFAYRNNDFDVAGASGDVDVYNYMANLYYDFDFGQRTPLVPYVMGGLGALTETGAGDNDTVFAYQVGAGLSMPLDNKWMVTAGYRFLDSSDFDGGLGDFQEHQIRAGLRYEF